MGLTSLTTSRKIGSPARNKCLGEATPFFSSLRLHFHYKITNQDERAEIAEKTQLQQVASSRTSRKPAFPWGSKLSSSAKRHQSKVSGSHNCMEILHISLKKDTQLPGSVKLFPESLRKDKQEPQQHHTNQADQKSTTRTQKCKLPLEPQPTKLGQDPCVKLKHGDCLLK